MYAGVPTIMPAAAMLQRDGRRIVRQRRGDCSSLRQAEVEQLDRAVRRDLDVGGLQIAMDDALVVRGFERVGDLPRDAERLVERNRSLLDPLGQRRPFDQLHHQRVLLDAVDRRDVRMIQRREHLRLAREARQARLRPRPRLGAISLMATSRPSLVSVAR